MISRTAFFDELVKIGETRKAELESAPTEGMKARHALKTMGVGAAGMALGLGTSQLIGHYTNLYKNVTPEKARVAKVILPILGGTTAMLAERYRSRMTDEYAKVRGYKDPRKKPTKRSD